MNLAYIESIKLLTAAINTGFVSVHSDDGKIQTKLLRRSATQRAVKVRAALEVALLAGESAVYPR